MKADRASGYPRWINQEKAGGAVQHTKGYMRATQEGGKHTGQGRSVQGESSRSQHSSSHMSVREHSDESRGSRQPAPAVGPPHRRSHFRWGRPAVSRCCAAFGSLRLCCLRTAAAAGQAAVAAQHEVGGVAGAIVQLLL